MKSLATYIKENYVCDHVRKDREILLSMRGIAQSWSSASDARDGLLNIIAQAGVRDADDWYFDGLDDIDYSKPSSRENSGAVVIDMPWFWTDEESDEYSYEYAQEVKKLQKWLKINFKSLCF